MASFGGLSTLSPLPHQDSLEIAGRLIDKFQQEDRNSLDVSEQLRIPKHSKCYKTGLIVMSLTYM